MKMLSLLGATAALALAPVASADPSTGPYVGVSAGAYTLDVDNGDFDDNALNLRISAGLKMNENLAIEGNYTKLFEAKDRFAGSEAELEADAWSLMIKPILPLGNLDLYAKAGWAWYDAEVSAQLPGLRLAADGRDDDFTWGAGAEFRFTDNFSLRGDFDRIELDNVDLNFVSAGLQLKF